MPVKVDVLEGEQESMSAYHCVGQVEAKKIRAGHQMQD